MHTKVSTGGKDAKHFNGWRKVLLRAYLFYNMAWPMDVNILSSKTCEYILQLHTISSQFFSLTFSRILKIKYRAFDNISRTLDGLIAAITKNIFKLYSFVSAAVVHVSGKIICRN